MNSSVVKLGKGQQGEGAMHCALGLARKLYDHGEWDGKSQITFNHPCRVYAALRMREKETLLAGVDYQIEIEEELSK